MMRAMVPYIGRLLPALPAAAVCAGCASYPAGYNRFAPPEDHPSLMQRANAAMDELELNVQRLDEWLTRYVE